MMRRLSDFTGMALELCGSSTTSCLGCEMIVTDIEALLLSMNAARTIRLSPPDGVR